MYDSIYDWSRFFLKNKTNAINVIVLCPRLFSFNCVPASDDKLGQLGLSGILMRPNKLLIVFLLS